MKRQSRPTAGRAAADRHAATPYSAPLRSHAETRAGDGGKAQRSIQSIAVGFRLIRRLEAAPGPLALKELAAGAGMSASNARLYLISFCRLGLVLQEETTGRYGLGPYAAQLGLAALNRMDVVALALEPMRALMEATGEAVFLTVWGNRGPCIVAKVDGPRFIPMVLRVGYTLPILDTATGRTFLAYLPHAAIAELLASERREPERRAIDIPRIVAEIRAKGLARSDSIVNAGFVALAAPIFDHGGAIVAAMTLIGPRGLMNADADGANERALAAAVRAVAGRLGHAGAAQLTPGRSEC